MKPSFRREILLVANMRSGSARQSIGVALSALAESNIYPHIELDLDSVRLNERVTKWSEERDDPVVTFGGDGTVGNVIDIIACRNVTLGILPAGTSNNFARSLKIPIDMKAAVNVIASGTASPVDAGRANGHYFGHAAIMGLNVDFARRAESLRSRIGRLSYPVASLLVFRNRHLLGVRIESEGHELRLSAFEIAILNSGQFGGRLGLQVPNVEVNDRRLRLLAVSDLRLRTLIKGLPHIFFQRHLGLPGASQQTLRRATVVTESPQDVTLDGEIKTQTPMDVEIVPNALRVLLPSFGQDN